MFPWLITFFNDVCASDRKKSEKENERWAKLTERLSKIYDKVVYREFWRRLIKATICVAIPIIEDFQEDNAVTVSFVLAAEILVMNVESVKLLS